jgi:hypothetical protein
MDSIGGIRIDIYSYAILPHGCISTHALVLLVSKYMLCENSYVFRYELCACVRNTKHLITSFLLHEANGILTCQVVFYVCHIAVHGSWRVQQPV